jgi:hypothetical protein
MPAVNTRFPASLEFNLSSTQPCFAHVFQTANRQPLPPFMRGIRA